MKPFDSRTGKDEQECSWEIQQQIGRVSWRQNSSSVGYAGPRITGSSVSSGHALCHLETGDLCQLCTFVLLLRILPRTAITDTGEETRCHLCREKFYVTHYTDGLEFRPPSPSLGLH